MLGGDGEGAGLLARIVSAIQQCLLRHRDDLDIQEHCESALEALM